MQNTLIHYQLSEKSVLLILSNLLRLVYGLTHGPVLEEFLERTYIP